MGELLQAAELLGKVTARLNTTAHDCASCHLMVHEDWVEHNWNRKLAGIISSLEKLHEEMNREYKLRAQGKPKYNPRHSATE